MAKDSFSSIQQVNRKGLMKKAVIIGGIIVAMIALATVLHLMRGGDEDEGTVATAPTPPAVPSSIRYYNPATEEDYETGTNYIIMNQSDGTRLQVNADGTVYLLDELGNIILQYEGSEREGIIERALAISDEDVRAALALTGLEDTIEPPPAEPSYEDMRRMMEESIAATLEDSYGMSLDDFYGGIYAAGMTPDQFYAMIEGGTDQDLALAMTVSSIRNQEEKDAQAAAQAGMSANVGSTIPDAAPVQDEIEYPDWLQTPDLTSGMQASLDSLSAAVAASNQSEQSDREILHEQVNGNRDQREWLDERQNVEMTHEKIDDWCLTAGTVVPITLITGINTDLPGEVVGQVRQNVYDSLTGRNILIPKGSRLIADYNDNITYGQKSVQIAWTELITPDGYVFTLPGFQGVDGQGFSGVEDKYNSHFWSILGGAFLGSVINMATGYTQEQLEMLDDLTQTEYITLLSSGMIDVTEDFASQRVEQMINRQPTIKIRTGYQTQLLVNQTIDLSRD